MKKRFMFTVIALVLALTFVFCSCGENNDSQADTTTDVSVALTDLGSGKSRFVFEVVDGEGNVTSFNVHTDETVVGEALQEYGLISGEEGAYGIYIKEVNGIIADYEIDGTYWAFYVDGEMSMKGADQVEIVEGATYSFRVEKG